MLFMGRDQKLIVRVNGHGFARINDVAGWMGVDYFTAARRIGKWTKAGLVRKCYPPFTTIVAIVPTAAGCEMAGDDLAPIRGIRTGTFIHDCKLIEVERQLLTRYGGEFEPTRRIQARLASSGRPNQHLPDGILRRPGREPVAIELELSVKAPRRLNEIMRAHAADMDVEAVWYLTDNLAVARAVKRAAKDFPHIRIGMLSALAAKPEISGQANNNEGDRK